MYLQYTTVYISRFVETHPSVIRGNIRLIGLISGARVDVLFAIRVNNMQFLYSAFSLPKLAQSALHIITPGRPVTFIIL